MQLRQSGELTEQQDWDRQVREDASKEQQEWDRQVRENASKEQQEWDRQTIENASAGQQEWDREVTENASKEQQDWDRQVTENASTDEQERNRQVTKIHIHKDTQLRIGRQKPSYLSHGTPLTYHDGSLKYLWLCFSSVPKYIQKNAHVLQVCAEIQPEERTAVAFQCRSTARRTHRCCISVPNYNQQNAPLPRTPSLSLTTVPLKQYTRVGHT